MAINSSAAYKLVLSAKQRQQLRTWAERAAAGGKTAEYLAMLKTINHHLTTEPLVWGDPWFRLSQLNLQVYERACTPLHISYAIDIEQRIVYVVKFTPFSASGLEEAE
jgi:hypothetical protein